MWQMIAKAALGGIGGGLKQAGNSRTNLSGNNQNVNNSDGMQEATEGMGKIFKKVKNTIAEKKKEKENANN